MTTATLPRQRKAVLRASQDAKGNMLWSVVR